MPDRVPEHLAIIMDGNGRWARARGLPRIAGHRAGTENLRRILTACTEFGIKVLTLYAFSTENWGRSPTEVRGLMNILESVIDRELDELHANGVQIRHVGRIEDLDPRLRQKVEQAVARTRGNDRLILNVALSYGGRDEIVNAVRRIVADGIPPERIDEVLIGYYMYTAGLPDPDLVVRTSGEMRISNFLIWQAAYSEFYFTPAYWPDFDEEELRKALFHYAQRERRFGLVVQPSA
ncbi:MAG: isoprenyl transferase [Anaerolineae bacterium]|nr:isoprenyl transferase [Anaerolineae bacterium]